MKITSDMKRKPIPLIDWISNIESSRDCILTEENEKEFSPFIINRVVARHAENLHHAYQMNQMPQLSAKMVYKYYHQSISKRKRYGKWGLLKSEKTPGDIQLISNLYNVSATKAERYLEVYSEDKLKKLRDDAKIELKN